MSSHVTGDVGQLLTTHTGPGGVFNLLQQAHDSPRPRQQRGGADKLNRHYRANVTIWLQWDWQELTQPWVCSEPWWSYRACLDKLNHIVNNQCYKRLHTDTAVLYLTRGWCVPGLMTNVFRQVSEELCPTVTCTKYVDNGFVSVCLTPVLTGHYIVTAGLWRPQCCVSWCDTWHWWMYRFSCTCINGTELAGASLILGELRWSYSTTLSTVCWIMRTLGDRGAVNILWWHSQFAKLIKKPNCLSKTDLWKSSAPALWLSKNFPKCTLLTLTNMIQTFY